MQERAFDWVTGGLLYSSTWEDPEVDLAALDVRPGDRVVTIASAGDNPLAFLLADPSEVWAVDRNPAQVALARLKAATLAWVPAHRGSLALLGGAGGTAALATYDAHVRPRLDASTRAFWEESRGPGRRVDTFGGNYHLSSVCGRVLRGIQLLARCYGATIDRLLAVPHGPRRRAVWDASYGRLFGGRLATAVASSRLPAFGLGIAPRQFARLRQWRGDLAAIVHERVKHCVLDFPLEENPFAWQALGLRYDLRRGRALALYLRPEHHEAIQSRAPRVRSEVADLTSWLSGQPRASVDRFALLDAQDWMAPAQIAELWQQVERTARHGARVVFRTVVPGSPVDDVVEPAIRRAWERDDALSERLTPLEKTGLYAEVHAYVRR
jgi:S-adenosylmethionine-diacylglycerol 3-amino-3-carboxypropyl transferase